MGLLDNANTSYNYGQNSGANWSQSSGWNSSLGTGMQASALSQINAQTANEWNERMMEKAMEFNAAEAQKNRDWQENMSNTAYQRAVADMTAAGINPILAAGGGASTPTGGMASTSALGANMAREYTDFEGMNQSSGGGWQNGYSYGRSESNMAEQVTAIARATSDLIGELKNNGTGKKLEEHVRGIFNKADSKIIKGAEKIIKETEQNMNGLEKTIIDTARKNNFGR